MSHLKFTLYGSFRTGENWLGTGVTTSKTQENINRRILLKSWYDLEAIFEIIVQPYSNRQSSVSIVEKDVIL